MQGPQFVAVAIISAAMAMLLLVATWAGLSRRHWFLRAGACGAMLIALYPIRAFEPLVWMAAAVPLTAWLSRFTWRRTRRETSVGDGSASSRNAAFQFRLTDFFLAILLAGVASAVGAALWRQNVAIDWRVGGVVFCCVVLHQLCLLVALSREWSRLLASIVLAFWLAASVACYAWQLFDTLAAQLIVDLSVGQPMLSAGNLGLRVLVGVLLLGLFVSIDLAVFLVWMLFWLPALDSDAPQSDRQWAHRVAVSAILAALAPMIVVYARMIPRPPVPEHSYGGPNSFHEIEAAARPASVAMSAVDIPPDERYAELLAALETPGYVPFDFGRDSHQEYINTMMAEAPRIRSLALNLEAEAKIAAANENYDEASRYALASVQIGNSACRGGLYIHFLVGSAVQGVGMSGINDVRRDISDNQAASLIRQLECIDRSREPIAATIAREVALEDCMFGWAHRLQVTSHWLLGRDDSQRVASIVPRVEKRCMAFRRLLIVELAIQRYQANKGRLPPDLKSLVPEFMASVPIDAFSGKPLIYLKTGDSPVVYSVGRDGKDDGGRFGTFDEAMFEDGFDFDLDFGSR